MRLSNTEKIKNSVDGFNIIIERISILEVKPEDISRRKTGKKEKNTRA